MRIRISTALPLPPLKVWYLLPASVETILDLKTDLVKSLPAFKGIKPTALSFEVDGFEVLGPSRCEVLNEERDVLCVKLVEDVAPPSKRRKKDRSQVPPPPIVEASSSSSRKKRKLSPSPAPTPSSKKYKSVPPPAVKAAKVKKQKVKAIAPPPPAPALVSLPSPPRKTAPAFKRPALLSFLQSSDSDLDSNSSSSSSSSSSSCTSSSDSDSSSSSSGPSSGPETSSSKLLPTGRALMLSKSSVDKGKGKEHPSTVIRLTPVIPNQPPVPPGQGLSATHERNVRRRKKKAALKLLGSAAPPSSSATLASSSTSPPKSVATVSMPPPDSPSPATSSQAVEDFQSAPVIPFLASSNRNKKRDFKKAMATAVGTKTVFANANVPKYLAVPPPPSTPSRITALQGKIALSTPTGGGKRPYQHVLAPSERTTLPAGMFVTSVDVETAEWEAAQGWGVEVEQEQFSKTKGGKGGEEKQQHSAEEADRRGREENGADGSKEWNDYIRLEEASTSAADGELAAKGSVDWATVDATFEKAAPISSFEQLQVGWRVGWKELMLDQKFTPVISLLVGTVSALKGSENVSIKMEQRPLDYEDEEMYDDQEEMQSTQAETQDDEIRVFEKDEVLRGEWRSL